MNLAFLIVAAAFAVPDAHMTPGSTFPTATTKTVCKPGYSSLVRNLTTARKKAICLKYGIKTGCPGNRWELDHYISLENGGDNSDANIWPQPIDQARLKDVAETRLHKAACRGEITLKEAQQRVIDPKEWGKP